MGVNPRILARIEARLSKLEALVGKVPKNEVLKEASLVPYQITKEIGSLIAEDYALIESEIDKLPKWGKFTPEIKHNLQQLKKDVPNKYSLPTNLRTNILNDINKIVQNA